MRSKMAGNIWMVLLALGVFIAGCAGAVPWNPQGYAGITKWKVVPSADCLKAAKTDKTLCYELLVMDGKEKQDVTFDISRKPDGTFLVKYDAKGVKAFTGQQIRAEVEIQVAKTLEAILPGMVESMVQAILKAVKPI